MAWRQVAVDDRLEGIAFALSARAPRPELARLIEDEAQRLLDDGLLRIELAVESAVREPGRRCDGIDRGAADPLLADEPRCGREDSSSVLGRRLLGRAFERFLLIRLDSFDDERHDSATLITAVMKRK
jgi:hypothetical protein